MAEFPEVYQVAMRFRKGLRVGNDAALERLVEAYGRIYESLLTQLRAIEAEILEAREAGTAVNADWLRRRQRYQSLIRQVEEELGRYGATVETELGRLARTAMTAAERDALELVAARLPLIPSAALGTVWDRLPVEAVEALLGFLEEGSPLWTRLRSFGVEAAKRIGSALEESLALGYSPRALAETLRRQAGMGLTDALRYARTVQINAYREASRAAYVANSRLVPTWTWVSALDPQGTCMGCVARHGSVHPVSERLNDHWQGWCCMVPNPVSYRELGLDVDGPPMDDIQTGAEWFAGLGEGQQRRFLRSEVAWRAWQDGKVHVEDFLGSREDDVWGPMVQEMSIKGLLGEQAKGYYGKGK